MELSSENLYLDPEPGPALVSNGGTDSAVSACYYFVYPLKNIQIEIGFLEVILRKTNANANNGEINILAVNAFLLTR